VCTTCKAGSSYVQVLFMWFSFMLDHGLLLSPFRPLKNGKRDGIMKFVSIP
jgi:hypothetical protein